MSAVEGASRLDCGANASDEADVVARGESAAFAADTLLGFPMLSKLGMLLLLDCLAVGDVVEDDEEGCSAACDERKPDWATSVSPPDEPELAVASGCSVLLNADRALLLDRRCGPPASDDLPPDEDGRRAFMTLRNIPELDPVVASDGLRCCDCCSSAAAAVAGRRMRISCKSQRVVTVGAHTEVSSR